MSLGVYQSKHDVVKKKFSWKAVLTVLFHNYCQVGAHRTGGDLTLMHM